MVVMKMNKKYTDNLSESSSEIETTCSPSRAHFSISLRKYLPFSVFFFLLSSPTVSIFFSKKSSPSKNEDLPCPTLPALCFLFRKGLVLTTTMARWWCSWPFVHACNSLEEVGPLLLPDAANSPKW